MLRRIYTLIAICLATPGFSIAASGFIDTPDQCYGIDRIVKAEVYLKKVAKCEGHPGRAFIEASHGETRTVFADETFWSVQTVKSMEVPDVAGLAERGAEMGNNMALPVNPYEKAMALEAAKTKTVADSPEFKARVSEQMQRIGEQNIGEQFTKYYKDAVSADSFGMLREDERIYVFISETIPIPVLRTYAADILKLHDPRVIMVLRGFVGGMSSIGPTAGLIAKITNKDASCNLADGNQCPLIGVDVIVDPMLFRRYGITQVPSFVYTTGVQISNPEMSEGKEENTQIGDFYSLSGDVSLKYALNRFGDATGEAKLSQNGLP